LGNASDAVETSSIDFSDLDLDTRNLACYLHLYFSCVNRAAPLEVKAHPA
jgi:hypothetical protein